MHQLIEDTYRNCLEEMRKSKSEIKNRVKDIYKPFSIEEINDKIVEMLRPEEVITPIEIVYQSIEGLHTAIPLNHGDWYFTGNFPTYGGTKLCNQSYINYIEKVYQYEQKF